MQALIGLRAIARGSTIPGLPDSPLSPSHRCRPALALTPRLSLTPPPPRLQINDRYEFPDELDLDRDNYLSRGADRNVRNVYKLHSVLVHSGGVHGEQMGLPGGPRGELMSKRHSMPAGGTSPH